MQNTALVSLPDAVVATKTTRIVCKTSEMDTKLNNIKPASNLCTPIVNSWTQKRYMFSQIAAFR